MGKPLRRKVIAPCPETMEPMQFDTVVAAAAAYHITKVSATRRIQSKNFPDWFYADGDQFSKNYGGREPYKQHLPKKQKPSERKHKKFTPGRFVEQVLGGDGKVTNKRKS